MKFIAIDGGDRIGASLYYLELANRKFVIDAGILLNRRADPKSPPVVPDLGRLSDAHIDLILITHAHIDHIGSLPILAEQHPEASIYMTLGTKALMEISLRDMLQIAQRNELRGIFSARAYENLLERVKTITEGDWIKPFEEIEICFWPSGHLRGASSIMIKSPDELVMFSGDISFSSDETVSGAKLPNFRPHTLIAEATAGDIKLPDQELETDRLVQKVLAVRARGGHSLIPTRAAGPAQAIAMKLAKAGVQTYLGGLANNILRLFELSHENIIPIGSVSGDQLVDAARIATSPTPSVVISTSETLTSGLSRDFAYLWMGDEKNAILFPNFRVREILGRKILGASKGQVAHFPEREGEGEDVKYKKLLAEVAQFRLSGHADGVQLAQWIGALDPERLILIHGTRPSFRGLEANLSRARVTTETMIGKNGKTIS